MTQVMGRRPHGVTTGLHGELAAALFFGDDGQVTELGGVIDQETHIVCVQVRPLAPTDFWLDGHRVLRRACAPVYATHLVAAGQLPRAICYGSFGVLQLYLPHSLVEMVARSLGAAVTRPLEFYDPRFSCDAEIALIARDIYYLLEKSDIASRAVVDALGFKLAIRLLGWWSNLVDLRATRALTLTAADLNRLRRAVRRRPAFDWNASTLADVVRLEPQTFVSRFEATVDLPPDLWLEDERLDAASATLLQFHASLKEVALTTGWSSPKKLRDALARRRGTTPEQIRRMRVN